MPKYVSLTHAHASAPAMRISRAKFLAVQVNMVAFTVLGTYALASDLGSFLRGARASENALFTFVLLAPIWIAGSIFAVCIARRRVPSAIGALWTSLKFTALAAVIALPLVLLYGSIGLVEPIFRVGSAQPQALDQLRIALTPLALPIAYCCFLTFGLINGYLGTYFSVFNTALLLMKLQGGERIDAVLWFNLLGLVDIQSAFVQWSLLSATIALGLAERTFRLLENDA